MQLTRSSPESRGTPDMFMSRADKADRTKMAAGWETRRKVLLAVVALVPALLLAYSLVASAMVSIGDLLGDGLPLLFSAVLIIGIGGYVIWDSLTPPAHARVRVYRADRRLSLVRRRPH